jgi:cytidylate kinase
LLVERQRSIASDGDWIAEGRDQGTAVFPDSPCKIYLDADPAVRAERRAGDGTAETAESIAERDARDAGRATDPLRPADDAVVVDTTGLTIDQVVERVAACVSNVAGGAARSDSEE